MEELANIRVLDPQVNDCGAMSMDEYVSMKLLNSCLPKALKVYDVVPRRLTSAITCGSAAEFYIEPLQTCIGDRDRLLCDSAEIAFSGDVPFLPYDVRNFHAEIKCFCLEPYKKYPGFVRLKYAGKMKYEWDLNKYKFYKAGETAHSFGVYDQQRNKDLLEKCYPCQFDNQVKGPAVNLNERIINEDIVIAMYCPQWPTEAKDWVYRQRNYGWPTKANLHKIANMGCHVVYVQHRDCRDDYLQWRLSFSFAEVVLLRSWTKTQQLVYHLLRFFAKREFIQKDCPKEKEVLCTYHLKTLMLWTCEQESPEWWNFSVIGLCFKLLIKLLEWLQRRRCPNYFIPEANLFHDQFDPDIYKTITGIIQSLSRTEILSLYFYLNYILPYLKEKGLAREAYDDSSTMICLTPRVSLVANEFLFRFEVNGNVLANKVDRNIIAFTIPYSWELNFMRLHQEMQEDRDEWGQISFVVRGLPVKSENCIISYATCAYMLTAAGAIMCKDVLCYKTLLSDMFIILSHRYRSYWPQCNNFPRSYETTVDSGFVYILKAQKQMRRPYKTSFDSRFVYFWRAQEQMAEMPASVNDPEFQLLSRLSMEFLRKSVTGNDAISEDIRPAAFAYMAAICFVTSQYQTAVDLCSEILTNSEPFSSSGISTRKKEPLSAGCLIFIDDVSNIIGYLFLCRHVLDTLLDRRSEINPDLRLSSEVFAQYVMIKSMQRLTPQLSRSRNKIHVEFLMDALLTAVMKRKLRAVKNEVKSCSHGYKVCIDRRSRSVSELLDHVTEFSLNEEMSIRLLMECSLKNIASIYEDAFKDSFYPFNTMAFIYRVVYLYRCRHYDEVKTLCRQILREPFNDAAVILYLFETILTLPPFSSFFDEEMQSLVGFQTLCIALFPIDSHTHCLHEIEGERKLLGKLFKSKKFTCHYILRRHFLARYLQLRCLIDTNGSLSEVLTAFGKLKCRLHFEDIIRTFLWQKLQKSVKYFE